MPQRDTRKRIERAKNAAGVQNEVVNPCATWDERDYWMAPKEITGGVNSFYLHDPRPLDQPDISYEHYAAEMDRREQEDPSPDWETSAEDGPPDPEVRPWEDSYRVSCAMRRYVYPRRAPKVKKVEPVDAPDQTDLEIE